MSMRFKIKFTNNHKKSEDEILHILATIIPDVIASDIFPTREGAIIVLDNINDVNQLMLESTHNALKKHFLKIPVPQWYLADRTIFLPRARQLYTERDPDDLLAEFNHHNKFKAVEITIIKPKHKDRYARATIKILMKSSQDADSAIANGIKMDHSIIKPEWIKKEKVIDVQQCFICFKFDHIASQCKRQQCLCSICGGDHHFTNCTNPNSPTCINCKGSHTAVSNNCPDKIQAGEEFALRNKPTQIEKQTSDVASTNLDVNSQKQFPAWPGKPNLSQPIIPSAVPQQPIYNNDMPQNYTTFSNQMPVQPPNSYSISPSVISAKQCQVQNEWNIRFQIMNKYADMIVEENPRADVYLDVMNKYLVDNEMQSLKPYTITPNKKKAQSKTTLDTQEEVEMPFSLSSPASLPPLHNTDSITPITLDQTNSSTPIPLNQTPIGKSYPMPNLNLESDSETQDTIINSPESSQLSHNSIISEDNGDVTLESTNSEKSQSEINQTVIPAKQSNPHTQSFSDSDLLTPYQHPSKSTKKTKKRKKKHGNLTLSDRVLRSETESEPDVDPYTMNSQDELVRNCIKDSIKSTFKTIINKEMNK